MALAKTKTLILGTAGGKTAAASGSTTLSDCTTIDTTSVIALALDVSMNFNAAATQGALVKIFGSKDDTSWNNQPYDQFTISFTGSVPLWRAHEFAVNPAPKYLKVMVTNSDTGQSITKIYVNAITQTA